MVSLALKISLVCGGRRNEAFDLWPSKTTRCYNVRVSPVFTWSSEVRL